MAGGGGGRFSGARNRLPHTNRALRREDLAVGRDEVPHIALAVVVPVAQRRDQRRREDRAVDREDVEHVDAPVAVLIAALAGIAAPVTVGVGAIRSGVERAVVRPVDNAVIVAVDLPASRVGDRSPWRAAIRPSDERDQRLRRHPIHEREPNQSSRTPPRRTAGNRRHRPAPVHANCHSLRFSERCLLQRRRFAKAISSAPSSAPVPGSGTKAKPYGPSSPPPETKLSMYAPVIPS